MMTDIPAKLAERLADLDRLIAGNEADIADYEAQIKGAWLNLEKYRLAKQEIQETIALCRAAWREPAPSAQEPAGDREMGNVESSPRPRRDMREVVRQILRRTSDGFSVAHIAVAASLDGRRVREAEIEGALARMGGEVEQSGDRWRLAGSLGGEAMARLQQTVAAQFVPNEIDESFRVGMAAAYKPQAPC